MQINKNIKTFQRCIQINCLFSETSALTMQHLADCLNRHTAAMDRQTESNLGMQDVLTGTLQLLKNLQKFIDIHSNILSTLLETKKATCDTQRYAGNYFNVQSYSDQESKLYTNII